MDYKDNNTDSKKELKKAFQVLAINASPEMTDKNI